MVDKFLDLNQQQLAQQNMDQIFLRKGIISFKPFLAINNKKFKVSRFKSKYKYPIPNLDFKNFKRREDIEINFND